MSISLLKLKKEKLISRILGDMASRAPASAALLLTFNLLFFTLASSTYCPPPNPKGHDATQPIKPSPTPITGRCPKDTLKLGVCVALLKDLLSVTVGTPPKTPCCSLIGNLVDLEAAVCLCTTIKASVLGINLNLPVNLSLLLNYCGKKVPEGFKCA
ncbi:14 kDa proline-rich protein DC2.15 [Manihot esculenta]|nr:14 kDa proline-rich protein DC2.15 [Manihot esculenta]